MEPVLREQLGARWGLAAALDDRVGHKLVAVLRQLEGAAAVADRDPGRSAGLVARAARLTAEAGLELSELVISERARIGQTADLTLLEVRAPSHRSEGPSGTGPNSPGELGRVLGLWARVLSSTGVEVRIALDGDTSLLAPQVTTVVAGVLDEALAKIAAYTTGGEVEVRLSVDGIGARLEVAGSRPCEDSRQGSRFGATERLAELEACGGWLSTGATAGTGFALQAWVPISSCPAAGGARSELVGEQDKGNGAISVLVVDDDTDLLETLPVLLEVSSRLRCAGVAADAATALRLNADNHPDVVLAHVGMAGTDGISLTRALTGGDRESRPKVVLITTFALDRHLLAAIGAGASGFLPKGLPWEQLEQAVIDVHRGGTALPPHLARRALDLSLSGHPGLGSLSERELEVLGFVGTGRSPKQIASALQISEGTVKVHLEHLRSKLDATNQVQLAIIAVRAGLSADSGGS